MIESVEAQVIDPNLVKRVHTHLLMAAFTGTAKHLINDHGIDPELIDLEDKPGLAHDHIHLHGGVTRNEPGTGESTTHWVNPHM